MNEDNNSNAFRKEFEMNKPNNFSNFINFDTKEKDEENNELKNLRIETSLSLRKKKLNEIILSKRKNYFNRKSPEEDEYDIYIDIETVKKNIPSILEEEFDQYEEKLSLIHQILNNDFSPLKGMQFQEESVKIFMLNKLQDLTYSENTNIFEEKYEKDLKLIFYDIIKMLNEIQNKKLFYGLSAIIVNFLHSSAVLVEEFKNANIWKKLAEFSEFKIPELNDNIIIILVNYYSSKKSVGKEYILSNYSRYIKQIITNYFKTFIDESNKKNFDIKLYRMGVSLVKRLIKNENRKINKSNDFDVVVKMKFIYDYLTKLFLISSSMIINNSNSINHLSIFQFISSLLECLSAIATYADEETYQMQEFCGESFATSFCSLIKFLILNKEKGVPPNSILIVLTDLYNFLGLLFSFENGTTEIFTKNKIIVITEEFIKNINSMENDLAKKIIFFLSNYADNENRCKEIFEESSIPQIIKSFTFSNLYDNNICYNCFCLIENGFKMGGKNCKEIIIQNFTDFLIERIKLLFDLISINEGESNNKYICHSLDKCELLYYFIIFIRDNNTNLQLIKDFLDYLKKSNIDELIENMQTFSADNRKTEVMRSLLEELNFINY